MSEAAAIGNSIDLLFPAMGAAIPRDHGYSLYSAICHVIAAVHSAKDIGIFPIPGSSTGNDTLQLTDRSALRLRIPASRIPELLPLAGKSLDLAGHHLRLGVPRVAALTPAATLASPLVLIKLAHTSAENKITEENFLAAATKQLTHLGIQAEPALQKTRTGPHAGQPRRRIIKIKNQTHPGYAMIVQGLTAEESILLQEQGIGGRRLMGCGLFLPTNGEARDAQ